ncbi:MAG: hypothetical protein P8O16_15455 [Algoriphagus sp.]|uniref:DUF4886 domain-containing protein n=1 Tax=Algoriphagus sp. TaxID=1872435 RepID=UPI0026224B29|nr:DUF4886 domain-containing protein [Algoriphagus sp.]MDG1278678.1 hypothetical protein [Algoriphagus sp.]
MTFKKLFTLVLAVSLLILAPPVSFSQESPEEPLRVLFVGNSFTYFYNLPQVVAAMAESQGKEIITRQSTVGGSNLGQHWRKEKGTKTMGLLETENWDYVVFNNHSTSPIDSQEEFDEYGKKFAELVKSKGAQPVFMQTWAYKSNPLMQPAITATYGNLAEETGSLLVPGGMLFQQVRQWRPDMNMFFDDKHPSSNATYLLGLAFYRFFTNDSLEKIPARITTIDKDGELLYLLFVPNEDADFLKQIVVEANIKSVVK